MKKSVLTLAVLGSIAGAASAQSSVTVFGVVDQSVNRIDNNGKTVTQMQSNQLSSNQLGFRGSEDLGGGLSAGFWLESSMANETGTVGGAAFFNRDSWVNLRGAYGELRFGHDYTPTLWNFVVDDVFGGVGIATVANIVSYNLGSNAATIQRANNMVQYFLPGGLGGLYGQISYALGQNQPGNKLQGGRIGYSAGPLDISVAYTQTQTQTADDFKLYNLGGSYNFGVARLFAYYSHSQWGGAENGVYSLSVGIPVGPGEIRAAYGHSTLSGTNELNVNFSGSSAQIWGAEYVYNLSRLTALYTTYGHVSNTGPQAAFAVQANGYSALNATSSGVNLGMRVRF